MLRVRAATLGAAAVALAAGLGAAAASGQAWHAQDEGVRCVDKPASPDGYAITAIGADRAQLPDATPPIAILDSGIGQVPELSGRIQPGINVTSGSSATNDNNGHGTAVASVAAAAAGGVRGVSPTSPLIPIKVFDIRGETTADWVIAGMKQAVARGARVINISAAGPGGPVTVDDRRVTTAIEDAVSKGVVVVAPSGNEGLSSLDVPASYPHVLAVAATDTSSGRASFSNGGAGLDLAAPGEDVVTATPSFICGSGYSLVSGTSFAAPAVAGAAATLEGSNPQLDASQVIDMVRMHAARNAVSPWSSSLGFGLLDVPAVLAAPVPRAQPAEVDDDVHWVKRRAFVLAPRRARSTVVGTVTTRLDPADVVRVQLKKGDRFNAATTAGTRVSLWSGRTGEYDITADRTSTRVVRAGGRLRVARIRKSGTYYVAVTPGPASYAGVDYTLTLSRSR